MPKILASIACNLDAHILQAALPLFKEKKIQAIEWSFDSLYKNQNIPNWFVDLLSTFSQGNRLIGHGVYFSLFAGKWSKEQQNWLKHLEKICRNFQFDHITEHFGFTTGENFHQGAPISIPFTKTTLAIGQDRLKRIQQASQTPVGLENLAIAYSLDEVKKQGDFLDQLVQAINGFIILDLHNLYCQIHNFNIDFDKLIQFYPLDRVREIHISGGSWESCSIQPDKKIRRDTHDDTVPEEVFDLLKRSISLCPNLKYVVLEQIGTGLRSEESRQNFQRDFLKMTHILEEATSTALIADQAQNFLPKHPILPSSIVESIELHKQQLQLSQILENATDYKEAQSQLANSSLANSAWNIEKWEAPMLETVIKIAQKWKQGFV